MICDGVLPSNEGRGYVLRRLLRRAARHGKLLGVNEPFLYEVCDTVIHENEGHYPELRERQDYITKVIRVEEENFAKTIDGGLKIFQRDAGGAQGQGEKTFSGADAFKLYDTYGFPIDLTLEMVEEQGMELDEAAFHKPWMEEQRQRPGRPGRPWATWAGPAWSSARMCPRPSLWAMTTPPLTTPRWWPWWWRTSRPRSSCPAWRPSWCWTRPLLRRDGRPGGRPRRLRRRRRHLPGHRRAEEQGRQVYAHRQADPGRAEGGRHGLASIDAKRRKAVMRAHSATHLLDKALQTVLGDHVHQAGSLVEPDRLRFDFTHFSALTAGGAGPGEPPWSMRPCWRAMPSSPRCCPSKEAKKRGAIALFGEKYGDTVRVVDMGRASRWSSAAAPIWTTPPRWAYSTSTASSPWPPASRIEATTGLKSLETMNRDQSLLFETAAVLKAKPAELREKAEQNMAELREMRHRRKFQAREAAGETERFSWAATIWAS